MGGGLAGKMATRRSFPDHNLSASAGPRIGQPSKLKQVQISVQAGPKRPRGMILRSIRPLKGPEQDTSGMDPKQLAGCIRNTAPPYKLIFQSPNNLSSPLEGDLRRVRSDSQTAR